jgi:hypothetical protein
MTRVEPRGAGDPGRVISEAELDRTLADSFPASDPPFWTLGVDYAGSDSPKDAGAPRSPSRHEPSSSED